MLANVRQGARHLILMALIFWATPAFPAQVIDIPMGVDKAQRILFFPAVAGEATVILLPGGDGIVGIRDDGGAVWPNHTFTRSMTLWSKNGINAVLFDSPNGLGNHGESRNDADHLRRIAAVIDFIRKKSNLPVWLVGHSNGTLSVSNYINASPDNEKKVDGLVILGTEHRVEFKRPLKLPILAIHHVLDGCNATPIFASVRVIEAAKLSSPRADMIKLDGGREESMPCKARSHHGFLGIEDELIARISTFIRKSPDKHEAGISKKRP